jgi:hypothetical protein
MGVVKNDIEPLQEIVYIKMDNSLHKQRQIELLMEDCGAFRKEPFGNSRKSIVNLWILHNG